VFTTGSLPADLLSGLWSSVQEPRIWFVFAISLIGGVVRGYSGFGGALIVIPLAAMAMGPTIAVPMFYLFDLGSATPYGYRALPACKWSEILPMLAGHLALLPVGAWMLTSLDATSVRWGMEICVVAMLVLLISGWRYTGRPNPVASVGVGAFAGTLGSATGISGPPIIAYWLGQKENAAAIRTNIMAYYALSSTATDVLFLWRGLFTWQVLIYAIIIWPAYALGLWGGAKLFKKSSDTAFRVSAYVLIAISAVLSLPLLDRFLK
jgi:uncharacterized membrane protein YfcA